MKSKKIPYWKHRLHEIVYEADTPAGKRFDLILLILILLSVVLVMLESVSSIHTGCFDHSSEMDACAKCSEQIVQQDSPSQQLTRRVQLLVDKTANPPPQEHESLRAR